MVAVIAGVLVAVGLPLLIALLVAIVVALPLSLFLFRGLRARLAGEIDVATASRRERRERLRAELRGDVGPADSADGDGRAP
jgi:sensor domain CHASE-containing protein